MAFENLTHLRFKEPRYWRPLYIEIMGTVKLISKSPNEEPSLTGMRIGVYWRTKGEPKGGYTREQLPRAKLSWRYKGKMRRLMTLTLLFSLALCSTAAYPTDRLARMFDPIPLQGWSAAPQAAQGASRHAKSQQELDAINAVIGEKDPQKKLALAEQFLKQYPDSELRDSAYVQMMLAYAQSGNRPKAIDCGNQAIQINPDSSRAYFYLGLVLLDAPPIDFDLGIWDMARGVAMAKAEQDKSAGAMEGILSKIYSDFHGSTEGMNDLEARAGTSSKPPQGFLVAGPKLYGPQGISPDSVRQGGLGSCYFHSTVAALAQSNPQLLKEMITDNSNGTYTVQFKDGKKETVYPEDLRFARTSRFDRSDGQWVGVLFRAYAQRVLRESLLKGVDLGDMFPMIKPYAKSFVESSDPLLLAYDRSIRAVVDQAGDMDRAQLESMLNEQTKGIPIPDTFRDSLLKSLESAGLFDAVAQMVKQNGELFGAYRAIGHGGIPAAVMQTLLAKEPLGAKIKSVSQVAELLGQVSPSKQPVVAGTSPLSLKDLQTQKPDVSNPDKWYVEGHAYTVLAYDLQAQTVTLRNPWGDHPDPDGTFTIPLTSFANSFEVIQTTAP